jgi:hypothetical protein
MPYPGFDDPRLASLPPGGNLYFGADVALHDPAEQYADPRGPGHSQAQDQTAPPLMFGEGTATTKGPLGHEAVANVANAPRGHWSEVLNFSGSPAPWILLGILLAAGILHLEANAKLKGSL